MGGKLKGRPHNKATDNIQTTDGLPEDSMLRKLLTIRMMGMSF